MRKFMTLLETCYWSYQWILLCYISSDFDLRVNSNAFGNKNLWILWFYKLCDEFSCHFIIDYCDLKAIIFELKLYWVLKDLCLNLCGIKYEIELNGNILIVCE